MLASSFLGGAGGFFVPMLLARGQRVTEAEATLTGYGGLQGLAHGTLLGLLLVDEEAEGRSVAAMMGALDGLALGHGLLVRSRDFGRAQGTVASLGPLAGSLAGGATSLAVEADEKTAAVLGAPGTLGGFAEAFLTWRGAGREPRVEPRRGEPRRGES